MHKPGDPLDGFQLQVPANSYEDARTFHISYAPIKSHTFGQNFNPISPLVTVDNGGDYSDEVMLVKIPVKIPDGNFAMGFFYDDKTKTLEGMPLAGADKGSLILATRHFSNFLVSMIPEYLLLCSPIYSEFEPGKDDWQFMNGGSVVAPGGHCEGQSISAMWYYFEKRLKGSPQLYSLYDNNYELYRDELHEKTKDLWQDDTLGYRLASVIQKDIHLRVLQIIERFFSWAVGPSVTRDMFAYTMLVTHKPQHIVVSQSSRISPSSCQKSHALIVYKIENGDLYMADPNYPGEINHKIRLINGEVEQYDANGTKFDQIRYVGVNAVIDWHQIADRWAEFEQKSIGEKIFPDYTLVVDDDGTVQKLEDGFKTNKTNLNIAVASTELYGTSLYYDGHWLNTDGKGQPVGEYLSSVSLREGRNKLGIWICNRYTPTKNECDTNPKPRWVWVDFKWVNVYYEPQPPTTRPVINFFDANPTTINAGERSTLSWSVLGAETITIDQDIGNVAANDTTEVTPTAPTTYTLTATNEAGSTTDTATVTVSSSPPKPDDGEVEITKTSHECRNPERIAGGVTVYDSVLVKGTAKGPVGSELCCTMDTKCTTWTRDNESGCWFRGPSDNETTEWRDPTPGGAIGGQTIHVNIGIAPPNGLTKWHSFPVTCPR